MFGGHVAFQKNTNRKMIWIKTIMGATENFDEFLKSKDEKYLLS
jgi:arginine repressor